MGVLTASSYLCTDNQLGRASIKSLSMNQASMMVSAKKKVQYAISKEKTEEEGSTAMKVSKNVACWATQTLGEPCGE